MKRRRVLLAGLAAVVLLGALGTGRYFLRRQGTAMPVLMYHHFVEQGPAQADTVVSAAVFEDQLRALKEGGYTSITPEQLLRYEDGEEELPAKPVMITMDDGYTSNLDIAAPLLEKYGMTATVFVIGINVGERVYPHSGEALDPPRFSWEQVRPWVDKGVLVVQSHTYDMHQRADYGFSGRDGVLPLEGEEEETYRAALEEDFSKARDGLERGLGVPMEALAFPFGLNSPQAVEELGKLGTRVTFSTQYGCRRVVPGREKSIQCIERWNITDTITGEKLVERLGELAAHTRSEIF